MLTLTESEYNAIHPDRRSVWRTERDDQPNWERDRHLYMGKRTMMSGDGTCSLLIEGLSFIIVPDPVPSSYRGLSIESTPVGYVASSDDVDGEFSDGAWRQCGGTVVHAGTIAELKDAVDEALEEECPTCTLRNGLRVLNFSSAHQFKFADGTILEACSAERAKRLSMDLTETEELSDCGKFTKISMRFEMSAAVQREINSLRDARVDIVLCPLPVIELLRKQEQPKTGPVFAGIRRTDRTSGLIHIDRFCV